LQRRAAARPFSSHFRSDALIGLDPAQPAALGAAEAQPIDLCLRPDDQLSDGRLAGPEANEALRLELTGGADLHRHGAARDSALHPHREAAIPAGTRPALGQLENRHSGHDSLARASDALPALTGSVVAVDGICVRDHVAAGAALELIPLPVVGLQTVVPRPAGEPPADPAIGLVQDVIAVATVQEPGAGD